MPFDLDSQIDRWRTLLLDTTKRNRLISFKVGGNSGGIALASPDPGDIWDRLVTADKSLTFVWKRSLIDLAPDPEEEEVVADEVAASVPADAARPDELARCLSSPRLRDDHLLTGLSDERLAARLTRLARTSRESLAEQGVVTLYVAFGVLRWFESRDSQVEVRSPLLLVPVRLERDNVAAPWRLSAEDEGVLTNDSLWHRLACDFQIRPPELPDLGNDAGDADWRTEYFGRVERLVGHEPRWEVLDEVALGTFNFQKLAMCSDLDRNRALIAANDVCRAIAGDPAARLRHPADLPGAADLDRVAHPASVHHILDADSSQHEAIAAVTRGASLVLDGPPGTGKSQTIANVIAECLAAGKTVLFVSEKAAALDVVHRRLQARGLADFCLACHSHKASKREVVTELARCLTLPPESCRDVAEELHRLEDARRRLNEYVRELHARRDPLGKSFYQAEGELARLAGRRASRCPVPDVLRRDAAYLRRVTDLLATLPACRGVIDEQDRHPWRGCRAAAFSPTLRDDVAHHFGRIAACLGGVREVTAALHGLGFCEGADPDLGQWQRGLKAARAALACPVVPAVWFGTGPTPDANRARGAAEAVVRLDDVSRACRQHLAALPEFSRNALTQAAPDELASVASELGVPLAVRRDDSLRSLGGRLADEREKYVGLRDLAVAAERQAQVAAGLLRTPSLCSSVKGLERLEEVASLLARLGPVRRSWWDAERRRELLAVFARCQEQARAAQEGRARLLERLSLQAFAPENAGEVAGAAGYRWFLMRLLPAWWSFRARAAGWYGGKAPRTSELLDDMAAVTEYHRATEECRQAQEHYAADLLLDDGGKPDWAGTLEGLRLVGLLERLLPGAPASLRQSLSGATDRQALAQAAQDLSGQIAELRRRLGRCTGAELAGLLIGDLAAWLQKHAEATGRRAGCVKRLAGLLLDGRDVPVADLPARVKTLAELGRHRAEASALWARACPGRQATQPPESRDWSAQRQTAAALLTLLEAWRGAPPAQVVRAITTQQVHGQLTEAVRNNDAACAPGFDESWLFLAQQFDLSTGITLAIAPLSELRRWLLDRAADAHRLQEWLRFRDVQEQAAREGVSAVLDEVLRGEIRPEDAADAFRARFLGLWLGAVCERVPALARFSTEGHERLIDEFRELDRRAVESASARVRASQLSRAGRPRSLGGEVPESSEAGTLMKEANRKRSRFTLRSLFSAIPNVLLVLKPCVMMSPLAVSTYLDSPEIRFDLVIFDEASQVRPHDAVAAICRGRQLVVAGDQKQLPPTSFFDRALEEGGEGAAGNEDDGLEDYESVLDVCCALNLPRRRLRWHYRSRREGLIAFSNQFIYGNELVTFPSPDDVAGNPAVAFEYVADGRWKAGTGGGYNAAEAARTAEMVLEHARQRPGESLGVIAFSQKQQDRILDALELLRKDNPDLEEFFSEDADEPFFVKNLENVQGDEREAIILAVGYGPNEATEIVSMNFGPLNKKNGERRLNVAVTRARRRVSVVSSMHASDIDLSRTAARGAELLRAYLDYAERGPEALRAAIAAVGAGGFDSPFEQEVYDELGRAGLTVHPQVGCGRYSIDLGVVDPDAPGRYLLGVECDGATYHSSATARDRDRLRHEVLAGLGWRICRIWSTDWWRDRVAQVRRVLDALAQAKVAASEEPPAPPPHHRTSPTLVKEQAAPTAGQDANAGSAFTPALARPGYKSIDEVPESVVRGVLCELLRACGATQDDDLIRVVTRRLGFSKTGSRIRARIEQALARLIQEGEVCRRADQRVQLAPKVVGA
jgi:very-short-patch-repair endonuclease